MRKLFITLLLSASLLGCGTISREAGYPGGNFGYLADRHAVFAQGQHQRVNRFLVTLALLAPLMAETAGTASEARLSSDRIDDLYDLIGKLGTAAKTCPLAKLDKKPTPDKVTLDDCTKAQLEKLDGSSLSFETMSFEVAKSLNDALKQAFDNLDVRTNATRLVALEPTEILKTVVKARHLVPVLLRYLATYRDVTMIFGLSVVESCHNDSLVEDKQSTKQQERCTKLAHAFGDLSTRTKTTDAEAARIERPIRNVLNASKTAIDAGVDWRLSAQHTAALIHHMDRACIKLTALGQIGKPEFEGCVSTKKETVKEDVNQIIENQTTAAQPLSASTTPATQ